MNTKARKTARLGELVAVAFEEAAHFSTDPAEIAHLATQAVRHLARRPERPAVAAPRPAV